MDPEKQPLLCPVSSNGPNIRQRGYNRTLTPEEVHHFRHEITWRRARFFLIVMFWSLMFMMLSIIICLLVSAPKCNAVDKALTGHPSIPPVHLTLAPLVAFSRTADE